MTVEITPLGAGVHRVTHPLPFALDHVHTYALEAAGGWTIVDAGHVWDAEARWRDALARLGNPPVSQVVVTHHHPDHIAGSPVLARLTGASLIQGRLDSEVASRMYAGGRFEGVVLERPARLVDEGDVIEAGGRRLRVFHMPGHADGHITLYDEQAGVLFGGDVILERITPNVSWWPGMIPDPLALYYETLDRLQALAPARVYAGHHGVIENTAARAAEIRAHHEERLDAIEGYLRQGAVTPDDVVARLWGLTLTPHELQFAYGEAVSHLQRLQRLGRAEEVQPGRWRAALS